jgi:hypothetical protein
MIDKNEQSVSFGTRVFRNGDMTDFFTNQSLTIEEAKEHKKIIESTMNTGVTKYDVLIVKRTLHYEVVDETT